MEARDYLNQAVKAQGLLHEDKYPNKKVHPEDKDIKFIIDFCHDLDQRIRHDLGYDAPKDSLGNRLLDMNGGERYFPQLIYYENLLRKAKYSPKDNQYYSEIKNYLDHLVKLLESATIPRLQCPLPEIKFESNIEEIVKR
ncbi:MAG: hypothetical protein KJ597_04295 [Nanoarchaeota archaeon]|nr:hypothetical protein [Nanoarchaeota archaeon]MBU1622768.1 hypothetical protein [Nanoarchaeota archaeon]